MRELTVDLKNAVYGLSGNTIHDDTIQFVYDMHKGRAYHNLEHAKSCVDELIKYYDSPYNKISDSEYRYIVIACYFHDIFHDLVQVDFAVRESAEIMAECLVDVLSQHDIKFIRDLIKSTGINPPWNEAQKVLHDCDYAILGTDWEVYKAYARALQHEAIDAGIPMSRFDEGRQNFLQMLAAVPIIYMTPHFGREYEWQARQNITREISERMSGVWDDGSNSR